jgi:hypothetical protein
MGEWMFVCLQVFWISAVDRNESSASYFGRFSLKALGMQLDRRYGELQFRSRLRDKGKHHIHYQEMIG